MEIPILKDLLVIFALSIGVLLVCHRLKIPTIVGFLLTGVICGPQGLQLVESTEYVDRLANIGIIVLLFIIGLEFSLKRIIEFKRFFLIAGPIQVILTTAFDIKPNTLLKKGDSVVVIGTKDQLAETDRIFKIT